ncbi:hypothetical protein G6L47_07195 [Agrobacterium rubi]|nr:hypothetical protein [Agrobacterium rubi]
MQEDRREWIADAVLILTSEPYSWTREQAQSYGEAVFETYFNEGFSADEAIEEDRQYWN